MTRYADRWTVQCAWLVVMGVVAALFVPAVMSATNLGMFALAGCAVLATASILWSAHAPTVPVAQARVAAEAAGGRG